MNLKDAILSLDPGNNDHWTSNGEPRLNVLGSLVGGAVSRQQIMDEGLGAHNRDNLEALKATGDVPPVVGGDASAPDGPPSFDEVPDDDFAIGDAPKENPADAAVVEVLDDVVGLSAAEVYSDIKLVDRAMAEFTRQNLLLSQRKSAIMKKMDELGKRTVRLSNQRAKLVRAAGGENNGTEGIQDYLKAQAKSREEKAARARRFIEAGTTAADVAKELGGKSAIDAAMSRRRHSSRSK